MNRALEEGGLSPETVTSIEELDYRASARAGGWERVRLRWTMYVSYPTRLCVEAVRSAPDRIFVVTSNTFFAPLLVGLIGKVRRFTTVHLLYDLFPDALEVSGAVRPSGILSRLIGWMTRMTQRICHGSVYLGELLARHAQRRWGPSRNDRSIDIGADDALFVQHQPDRSDGDVICHYGGQLGHMHDAEALVASIQQVCRPESLCAEGCRFHFNVSGAQSRYVHESLSGPRVTIEDAVAGHVWREKIRAFQIGLVTLSPGGATVCLPSKTYSMMAGGLAILAICPEWSDLAHLIAENDAGWVVNNSPFKTRAELNGVDYSVRVRQRRPTAAIAEDFERILAHVLSHRDELGRKRTNAWRCIPGRYGLTVIAGAWREYLETFRAPNQGR
ncbi:MAG: hypothetical protein AB9869_26760 [Verrucomicrobiia bacterium]